MATHFQQPTDRIVAGGVGKVAVPNELVVWPAGWIETTKYEPFLMDEQGAREVIAAFRALGVDLPIDYHHASIDPGQRQDGAAPAAGWITALRWDAARGLVATVNWTERAAGYIANREFRYHSPVGRVRESDNRFIELLSVSLTNEPATVNVKPMAASRGRHADVFVTAMRPFGTIGEQAMHETETSLGIPTARIEEFKRMLSELAGVLDGADATVLAAFARLFTLDDATMFRALADTLEAAAQLGAIVGREPESTVEAFSRSRDRVIAAGRKGFAVAKRGTKKVVCSEAAWVKMALRDAGLERMSRAETDRRGIVVAA